MFYFVLHNVIANIGTIWIDGLEWDVISTDVDTVHRAVHAVRRMEGRSAAYPGLCEEAPEAEGGYKMKAIKSRYTI